MTRTIHIVIAEVGPEFPVSVMLGPENNMGTIGGDSGSDDFCRSLFETMRDGCAHCRLIYEGDRPADWIYLAVNPAFEALTGLKEVVGRRVSEVVPGIRESSPEIFEVAGRVAAGGGFESLESYVKALDAWFSIDVMNSAPGDVIAMFKDITALRRGEQETAITQERFQVLFELSPDPITVNRLADGVLVMVNRAWCQLTGVPKEEAIGRSSPSLGLAARPEEWEELISELHEQPMNTPRVVTMRVRDGSERQILLNASRVTVDHEDLIIRIGKDVTYRQRVEMELRESAAAFESIFEMSPVPLFLQREGRFIHMNAAALRLFGAQEAAQLIGQSVFDRTPAGERDGLLTRIQTAQAGVQATRFVETRVLTLDGIEVDVEVLDRLVTYRGQPTILTSTHDIRERKQSEKALLEAFATLQTSERKFSVAFLASPDGISINRFSDGLFLEANDALLQAMGYPREEVIGRSSLPGDLGLWVHLEDRQRLQEALLRDGLVRGFQAPFRRKDGTLRMGLASAAFIDLEGERCVLIIIRDITERKRAEEALRQQEAFIRSVLDNLPVGIAVSPPDPAQTPPYMNDLFLRLYRTTREALEVVAAEPDAFWEKAYEDPAVRESIKAQVLEDIGSGDPSRMHWERIPITREGEETTFIDARNIPVPGTSTMISTVWDVTEHVRREEESLRLEAQLYQAQKMESLGLLAGGIAHDINNVLAAVLAVATIHRRKAPEGSPLHQDMETITQSCLRGGALAKSLLGFARKDHREERWLNLNDLVRDVMNLLKHTTLENISLQVELGDGLRDILGDPGSLNHVLMNLCVNAFEAMPGGGTLTIRTRNEGPDGILVEVEDTGIGMAQEVLSHALVPFYTTKQSSKGTGLGLSIVYGTVKSHRGTLDLQSEPGRGTLVRLRFPASDSAQAEKPGDQDSMGEGASAQKSILFVDDDPHLLQSMPRLLEHLGHSATAVASGEQALALIEQGFKPNLVILDVNMPGIGGLATLLELRKRDPDLPVLLSSGFASQPIEAVVQQFPGVRLIVKPYTLENLKQEIIRIAP